MSNIILCTICLLIGNFAVEAWHAVPNYSSAGLETFSQFMAIVIYHIFWAKE